MGDSEDSKDAAHFAVYPRKLWLQDRIGVLCLAISKYEELESGSDSPLIVDSRYERLLDELRLVLSALEIDKMIGRIT